MSILTTNQLQIYLLKISKITILTDCYYYLPLVFLVSYELFIADKLQKKSGIYYNTLKNNN